MPENLLLHNPFPGKTVTEEHTQQQADQLNEL
jgi:hypothetical protein